MDDKPGLAWRLQNIDVRIVHGLIMLLVAIPLLNPIGLPLQISEGTRQAYRAIAAIPPGSIVLFAFELGAATDPEVGPAAEAWLHQLMAKRVRIVLFSIFSEEAPLFGQRYFDKIGPQYGYVYGRDFINLPFRAGGETAVAAIARDIRGVFPTDWRGQPTAEMPLWQEITGMESFSMLLKASGWGPDFFVRQMVVPFGIPMVAACTGIVVPGAMAYLAAGQIQGLVAALAGAAEYEILMGRPGVAAAAMDAQSTTHALTVLLVLLGNVGYYLSRPRRGGRKQ